MAKHASKSSHLQLVDFPKTVVTCLGIFGPIET